MLKALEIREKVLPPKHPSLATSYNNVGITYAYMKDFSKAVEYLEKALAIVEKVLPPTHPYIVSTKRNLAYVRSRMSNTSRPSLLSRLLRRFAPRNDGCGDV